MSLSDGLTCEALRVFGILSFQTSPMCPEIKVEEVNEDVIVGWGVEYKMSIPTTLITEWLFIQSSHFLTFGLSA